VGSGSRGVGIALATEHAEVGVGWWMPVEDMVGSGKLMCFRGVAIEEVGGSVEAFHPVGRGKWDWKRRERMMLLMVRKTRSALPFCCEV
jgi:hypothetical protein